MPTLATGNGREMHQGICITAPSFDLPCLVANCKNQDAADRTENAELSVGIGSSRLVSVGPQRAYWSAGLESTTLGANSLFAVAVHDVFLNFVAKC